jgi:23S rRNA pseudouridine1911/1915/1917 synthase
MMTEYSFIVDENLVGKRVDQFLAEVSEFSRSRIQNLIKSSNLSINGEINSSSKYIVKINDVVHLNIPDPVESTLKARDRELDIVYEDEDLIVLNKQSDFTVHPGIGNYDDTLVNALLHHCKGSLSGINGEQRPGIVHRLDRDTTGLMVIAKNDDAHISLSEQIQNRSLKRMYKALVWGFVIPTNGTIDANIDRSHQDRTRMKVVKNSGKNAITHYRTIQIYSNYNISLVECQLETGRTHQIRVHMSHKGNSIVGDQVYGNNSRKLFKNIDDFMMDLLSNFKRQALHSYYISFTHPKTYERLEFEVGLPQDFQNLIDNLGK